MNQHKCRICGQIVAGGALPPISQLKARMRQLVWQEALQDAVKHSHERPVIRRLEKLLAA